MPRESTAHPKQQDGTMAEGPWDRAEGAAHPGVSVRAGRGPEQALQCPQGSPQALRALLSQHPEDAGAGHAAASSSLPGSRRERPPVLLWLQQPGRRGLGREGFAPEVYSRAGWVDVLVGGLPFLSHVLFGPQRGAAAKCKPWGHGEAWLRLRSWPGQGCPCHAVQKAQGLASLCSGRRGHPGRLLGNCHHAWQRCQGKVSSA